MNTWNQNQNQNMMMGQAQFNPYTSPNLWGQYQSQRLPIYHSEPIHGENAAWQFPMGPNSDIYLPDADEDLIWWIRTDNNGNKTVMAFDATPHKKENAISTTELEARLTAVEEWINGKQNKSNAKRSVATATIVQPTTTVAAE